MAGLPAVPLLDPTLTLLSLHLLPACYATGLLLLPWAVPTFLADLCRLDRHVLPSSYLVDPASSHMLVSKIKPCMSKYKPICTVKLRMAHYISYCLFDDTLPLG